MSIKKKSRSKQSRRKFIKNTAAITAAASTLPLFNINHAWSQDVVFDGQPFDSGGATLRVGEWGGFWEEYMRTAFINDFEKTYNCTVQYDGAWPWFPKYVANGPENPAYDLCNWNIPEMMKTQRAGDFFMSPDDIADAIPNGTKLWPFAKATGVGLTWAFGQYAHVYRTDLTDPNPSTFESFWEDRFAGMRGTYITSNTLQMVFFLCAAAQFGKDEYDLKAGFEAMKAARPCKLSDFTGNMQTLIERGEVHIGVQWEGEVYLQMDKGISVAPIIWEHRKPMLTQTHTVSKYADPMSKKLALAYVNNKLDKNFMNGAGETFYLRPTINDAIIPDLLASKGVTNDAAAMNDLWTPDWNWYLDNEDEIVETCNEIFAS
tara:strand:- start:43 stop:1167 length:1125 start_codon:yes stop_codon:yes gene_type:complete